jgi:hypothetical protein
MGYHWTIGLVSILGILFFAWLAVLTWWQEGFGLTVLLFLAFSALSLYCLFLSLTKTYVDSQGISVRTLFAEYGLAWDEIRSVETNPPPQTIVGNTLIFRGDDKALVVYLVFMDKNRIPMGQIFSQQILERQIKIELLASINPQHHNTKRARRPTK